MTATFFSGINGTGCKNHWTAFFREDGLVVEAKSIPDTMTKKNLNATKTPSFIPCSVMDTSKMEKRISPSTVSARAVKIKKSNRIKYLIWFKVDEMFRPDRLKKKNRITP